MGFPGGSKFSKPGFNSTWTMNFQMFKLDLEKAEEPENKLPEMSQIGNPVKTESFWLPGTREMETGEWQLMGKWFSLDNDENLEELNNDGCAILWMY